MIGGDLIYTPHDSTWFFDEWWWLVDDWVYKLDDWSVDGAESVSVYLWESLKHTKHAVALSFDILNYRNSILMQADGVLRLSRDYHKRLWIILPVIPGNLLLFDLQRHYRSGNLK